MAHVVEGTALVWPVSASEVGASGVLAVARSGNERIEAPVLRFEARVIEDSSWVAPIVQWRAVDPAAAPAPPAPAATFLAAVIPTTGFVDGETIHIGGQGARVRLWRREARGDAADAPAPLPAALESLVAPLRADPARAWRATLLNERRANLPVGLSLLSAGTPPALSGDAALKALEAQTRLRWGLGLHGLRAIDADLAQRVRLALTRTVRLADALEAPAWSADASADRALLDDLLSPTLSPDARRERVLAWLATQPAGRAWIADDAADIVDGMAAPRVGAANLAETPLTPEAGWAGEPMRAWNGPIPPGEMSERQAPARGAARSRVKLGAAAPTALEVGLGSWRGSLTTQRDPLAAAPPGVVMQRFLAPWTMRSWLAGALAPAPTELATVALLQRTADDAGWEIYIECAQRTDDAPADARDDVVRVFLGPRGDSRAILRVSADGDLVEEMAETRAQARDQAGPPLLPERVAHGESAHRWWAIAPVPAWAIEDGGLLRIGIERRRGAARAHWPRPVFPWDDEPGRALIDLTRWSPLGGP